MWFLIGIVVVGVAMLALRRMLASPPAKALPTENEDEEELAGMIAGNWERFDDHR